MPRAETDNLISQALLMLAEYQPFLYTRSKDGVSAYIHFRCLPGGHTHKLRISDHPERKWYGYKWQLRYDGNVRDPKQWSRYYKTLPELVAAFQRYYSRVEETQKPLKSEDSRGSCTKKV